MDYITAKDLCKMLGVDRVDVAALTRERGIDAKKISGRWKISKESAEALRKNNQRKIKSLQKEYTSLYWQGLTHQQLQKGLAKILNEEGSLPDKEGSRNRRFMTR